MNIKPPQSGQAPQNIQAMAIVQNYASNPTFVPLDDRKFFTENQRENSNFRKKFENVYKTANKVIESGSSMLKTTGKNQLAYQ